MTERLRAEAQWLGDDERIILARHVMAKAADNALTALLGRLKQASAVLDSGGAQTRRASLRAIDALNAIGAPVGGRGASKKSPKKPRVSRR